MALDRMKLKVNSIKFYQHNNAYGKYSIMDCIIDNGSTILVRCDYPYSSLTQYIGKIIDTKSYNGIRDLRAGHRNLKVICDICSCNATKIFRFRKSADI